MPITRNVLACFAGGVLIFRRRNSPQRVSDGDTTIVSIANMGMFARLYTNVIR